MGFDSVTASQSASNCQQRQLPGAEFHTMYDAGEYRVGQNLSQCQATADPWNSSCQEQWRCV